jgi:hypothetical protein
MHILIGIVARQALLVVCRLLVGFWRVVVPATKNHAEPLSVHPTSVATTNRTSREYIGNRNRKLVMPTYEANQDINQQPAHSIKITKATRTSTFHQNNQGNQNQHIPSK